MIKIKEQSTIIQTNDNKQRLSLENADISIIRNRKDVKPSLEKAKKGILVVK